MIRLSICILGVCVGCQAAPPVLPTSGPWRLVERPWIGDALDAAIQGSETTLVFERVILDRSPLVIQESRCGHRLRSQDPSQPERGVGETVEVTFWVDCRAEDLHRVEVTPTRPGVRILGYHGALGEVPTRGGCYVRGSRKVTIKYTADFPGWGGVKATLFEVGVEESETRTSQ